MLNIKIVETVDINSCIDFVELVKNDFAGYKKEEFLQALNKCIDSKEAIALLDSKVVGLILFSYSEKELQFLAVSPDYRKKGLAKKLINEMLLKFKVNDKIYVTTFREGDTKGIAARKLYHSCGFKDDEFVTVFDYPCQKMIYTVE